MDETSTTRGQIEQENFSIVERGFYELDGKRIKLVGWEFDEVQNITPPHIEKLEREVTEFICREPPEIVVMDDELAEVAADNLMVLNSLEDEDYSLRMRTSLDVSLEQPKAMKIFRYNARHGKRLGTDYMMFSPNVCVFRDAEYNLIEQPRRTGVLTLSIPNLNGAAKNVPPEKIAEVMKARLRKVFAVAIYHGYRDILVGALGCGALGHNPHTVAKYFYELLFDEGWRYKFKTFVFAATGDNHSAFADVFRKVSKKFSDRYNYTEERYDEISATPSNFYQNIFPYISFNFRPKNLRAGNIGYAHGMMKNGYPFTAEMWDIGGEKCVAFYLPVISKFMELERDEITEFLEEFFRDPDQPDDANKVEPMRYTEMVHGYHVLCAGMHNDHDIEDIEVLNAYVSFLMESKLVRFTTNFINGYAFVLVDCAGNELVCVTITLRTKGEEIAVTPLRWIPFNRPPVVKKDDDDNNHGLRLVKSD